MKKLLVSILCLLSVFTLIGCGKKEEKNVNLDLGKIKESLAKLTTGKFDRTGVSNNLYDTDYFDSELTEVFDYDFKDTFDITPEYIEEYSIAYNNDTKQFYMIIKPSDDKVKEEITSFIKKYNLEDRVLESKHEGFLIYIVSNNNNKVLEIIKGTSSPVFGIMSEITTAEIKDTLELEANQVEEFLMMTPMMIVNSNTYIIVKPANGEKDNVKSSIDKYMEKLEEQWKTYLINQYQLVKNRKYVEYGDYLIYIVSSDNDLVLKEIKKYNK